MPSRARLTSLTLTKAQEGHSPTTSSKRVYSIKREQHSLAMENGTSTNEGKDPSGFLSQIIGNPVTVKLNSGVVYKGM